MKNEKIDIQLFIEKEGTEEQEELSGITKGLQTQLRKLDLLENKLIREAPESDLYKGDLVSWGVLKIVISKSRDVLNGLLNLVRNYPGKEGRKVIMKFDDGEKKREIEVTGLSTSQLQALIDEFITH